MTESTELVLTERHDHVLVMTMNRPERHHALNRALTARLAELLDEAENDPDVRVVVLTGSGFEAGMVCERFKPHVMLVDLHLDDSDARGVAKLIQSTESLQMTRVVGMSGKLTDGQAHAIRTDGFDGFLKKPFQVRQVVEAIESITSLAA